MWRASRLRRSPKSSARPKPPFGLRYAGDGCGSRKPWIRKQESDHELQLGQGNIVTLRGRRSVCCRCGQDEYSSAGVRSMPQLLRGTCPEPGDAEISSPDVRYAG